MKDNSRFYIPVLSALVLASVVLLARFTSELPDDFQNYVCTSERCTLQDWLSATAGWVGFIAAAVGAYFVFAQLNEQRKQTSFLLGDAEPTIELRHSALRFYRASFEITNWNRRSAQVTDFTISIGDKSFPEPVGVSVDYLSEDIPIRFFPYRNSLIVPSIGGWVNRQKKPRSIAFSFIYDRNVEVEDFSDYFVASGDATTRLVTISVTIDIAGREYKLDLVEPMRRVLACDAAFEQIYGGELE